MCTDQALQSVANRATATALRLTYPLPYDVFLEEIRLINPCRYVVRRDMFLHVLQEGYT